MSFKLTAFAFALFRWIALVALALIPTIIAVVAYRGLRREPLWTLRDLPVAAEVTLCLAWLSVLLSIDELILIQTGGSMTLLAAVVATLMAAIPVAVGLKQIEELRGILGLDRDVSAPGGRRAHARG